MPRETERMMKLQDVILKAMAKKITWLEAAAGSSGFLSTILDDSLHKAWAFRSADMCVGFGRRGLLSD